MSFMSKPRKKPLSTNNRTIAITRRRGSSRSLPPRCRQDAKHQAWYRVAMMSWARPPKMVAQSRTLACLDGGQPESPA